MKIRKLVFNHPLLSYAGIAAIVGAVIVASIWLLDRQLGTPAAHSPPVGLQIYSAHPWLRLAISWFMSFAFVGLVLSIHLLLGEDFKDRTSLHKQLWIIWLVVPALWFVVEYFFVFPRWGDPSNRDALKYGQSVAEKLWAAGVVMSSAVLFKDFQKAKSGASNNAPAAATAAAPAIPQTPR